MLLNKNLQLALFLSLCVLLVSVLLANWKTMEGKNQWDFRAQYFATKAYDQGLNPFNRQVLQDVNDTPYETMPGNFYIYHPLTFNFFRLFTWMPYNTAVMAFMGFNFMLLLALLTVWKSNFLERVNVLLFPLVLAFSFNCSLFIALECGNIAVLETFFLWMAFLCFIKDRPRLFLILIVAISFFKLQPIVLSLMVFLMPGGRKNLVPFVSVMAVAALLWLSPFVYAPVLFRLSLDYMSTLSLMDLGIINPCSMAMIIDLLQHAGTNSKGLQYAIYLLWVAGVMVAYLLVIRRMKWESHSKEMVFFSLLTYAIIAPRFKHYNYMQLIPVAYFLVSKNPGLLVVDLFRLLMPGVALPFILEEYHPFLAAVINWGYLGWLFSPLSRSSVSETTTAVVNEQKEAVALLNQEIP